MAPATRNQPGKEQNSVIEVASSLTESADVHLTDYDEPDELGPRTRVPSRRAREAGEPPKTPMAPARRLPRKSVDQGPTAEASDDNDNMLAKLYAAVLEIKQDNVRLERFVM